MTTNRSRALSALALSALIAGCSLMPAYERPPLAVAAAYPAAAASAPAAAASAAAAAPDIAWRDYYQDDRLRRLIALALRNNRDLRVAALNIEQARARYGIQRAAALPAVDASAAGQRSRSAGEFTTPEQANPATSYSATIGFSAWELDFFGRVRSLNEQALQTFLATEQARRSTELALVGEVASAWLQLLSEQELLQIARDTQDSTRRSVELTQRRVQAGAEGTLALRQQQQVLETARADVAVRTTTVAQARNALELLLGTPLPDGLVAPALPQRVAPLAELPAGLPSDLLARRPDVLQAERSLRAANANIGAARAAFFPRIALTASAGGASSELGNLFKGGNRTWSFAPSVSLPIFDGGANRANLALAQTGRDIAVAQYDKAVQSAFRDVADALAARASADEQLAARQALADAAADALRLSQARYERGADSYLGVLDAQRTAYSAQQALVSARLSRLLNQVTLYKVLGGGAQDEAAAGAPAQPAS